MIRVTAPATGCRILGAEVVKITQILAKTPGFTPFNLHTDTGAPWHPSAVIGDRRACLPAK